MNIVERIKNKRKEVGLSKVEFARRVGVSLATVIRWEKGERTPNSSKIPDIAAALNTSVEYLMGVCDEEEDENENVFTSDFKKTMTFTSGKQSITVPFNEKLFMKIFQSMLNNKTNNMSITGIGNNANQIIK